MGNVDFFLLKLKNIERPTQITAAQTFHYANHALAYLESSTVTSGGKLLFGQNDVVVGWGLDPLDKMLDRVVELSPSSCRPNIIIDIQQGGRAELGKNDINNALVPKSIAIIHITSGSVFKVAGDLIINQGSKLIIEDGGKLIIDQGSVIQLNGDNAILEIKGLLEILPNAVFKTIGTGRVLINVPCATGKCKVFSTYGAGSGINLGDITSNGKVVLEFASNSGWTVDNITSVQINPTSIIEFGTQSYWSIAGTLSLDHAIVRGSNGSVHKGIQLYGQAGVNLGGTKFYNGNPALQVSGSSSSTTFDLEQCRFINNEVGVYIYSIPVNIKQCSFVTNTTALLFSAGISTNSVYKSIFQNNLIAIESDLQRSASLIVEKCKFDQGLHAISNRGGTIYAKCSIFSNYTNGSDAALDLTACDLSFHDGNVEFQNNHIDIQALDLGLFELENSGTRFSANGDIRIKFSINSPSLIPDANGYYFSGFGNMLNYLMASNAIIAGTLPRMYVDDPSAPSLHQTVYFTNCGTNFSDCFIAPTQGCWNAYGSSSIGEGSNNGNPSTESSSSDYSLELDPFQGLIVESADFNQVYLTEAVRQAISEISTPNQVNNDLHAIELLNQILLEYPAELPSYSRQERVALNLAFRMLNIAISNAFINQELNSSNKNTYVNLVNDVISAKLGQLNPQNSDDKDDIFNLNLARVQLMRLSGNFSQAKTLCLNKNSYCFKPEDFDRLGYWECVIDAEIAKSSNAIDMIDLIGRLQVCRNSFTYSKKQGSSSPWNSTNSFEITQSIKLMPNPSNNGIVYFNGNSTLNGVLKIYSSTGKLIKQVTLIEVNSGYIDLTQVGSGLYFVIHEENGVIKGREKLIVNR